MTREWSAEIHVDAALVRRLLSQFPQLEIASVQLLGEGWDNTVWVVDERWLFRLPRRSVVVEAVERQIEFLPRLGPGLPAPIPQPVFAGRPAEGFPWPFFGAPFLPGREPDGELADNARVRLARPLAEFLRALHSPELFERVGGEALPVNPTNRQDMHVLVPRVSARLAEVTAYGMWDPPSGVEALLEAALALGAPEARAVAHGDLHFRHVLVHENGSLAAVIDWDDLCRAEPAVDLQLVWSFFPPEGRREFLDAYRASEEQLLRARVLALHLCCALASYARVERLASVEAEAVRGLARTMTD